MKTYHLSLLDSPELVRMAYAVTFRPPPLRIRFTSSVPARYVAPTPAEMRAMLEKLGYM